MTLVAALLLLLDISQGIPQYQQRPVNGFVKKGRPISHLEGHVFSKMAWAKEQAYICFVPQSHAIAVEKVKDASHIGANLLFGSS